MQTALWISLLGMGLVFGMILLLWGLINLVMRFSGALRAWRYGDPQAELKNKEMAAAAAVAAALTAVRLRSAESAEYVPQIFPLPPTAQVSPWQAVMRSKVMNKRGPMR